MVSVNLERTLSIGGFKYTVMAAMNIILIWHAPLVKPIVLWNSVLRLDFLQSRQQFNIVNISPQQLLYWVRMWMTYSEVSRIVEVTTEQPNSGVFYWK